MRKALILILLACAGYAVPAYFLKREEWWLQLLCFAFEFSVYLWCIKKLSFGIWITLLVCLLPRLVWISATPVLSDDYYRFYWDGTLMLNGDDPYAYTPNFLVNQYYAEDELLEVAGKTNSPHYYSAYPPFNQLLFYIGASTGSLQGFVVVTRVLLILADLLIIFLIYKLTRQKKLNVNASLAYGLNPLVITELTGNLHMEGMCMAFWLLGVWLLLAHKKIFSIVVWAIACGIKLVPVYLIAVLWPARSFVHALVTGVVCLLVLLMSFNFITNTEGLYHFKESVGLYFSKFEFNASFYFLAREAGTAIKGYNPISIIGPAMGITFIITAFLICWYAWKKKIKDIFLISAFILFAYYLLATTVHPWYSINLLIPGVIAGLYFPIAWTGLIFLSYIFYGVQNEIIYYLAVTVEYVVLFIVFLRERHRWQFNQG